MDLIYMNKSKEDIGVLQDYTFDLAFGSDENNFECKIVRNNHCCKDGYFLYYEGTEYGGIIDGISVDTANEEVIYTGRTWHGILESKVLEPDAGEDYLVLSGEANVVLGVLIARMGLSGLFRASPSASGLHISGFKMERYIYGYTGIRKMLKASGAKLHISYEEGFAVLSAKPIVDYSRDERFDDDQIALKIEKCNAVNHVICLGRGDLAAREVVHVYADSGGNIVEEQAITGVDEIEEVYDYSNAESIDELRNGGIKRIEESWAATTVDVDFDASEQSYDIGDIVGADERITGLSVTSEIVKKIVKFANNVFSVSYQCGETVSEAIDIDAVLGTMILGSARLG